MNISIELYAKALYEASEKLDPLALLSELNDFISLIYSDDEVLDFVLKTYNQFNHLKAILKLKFSDPLINFLALLYEDRRLKDIVEIKNIYAEILMENKLLSLVSIYSKEKLSNESVNKILAMLENKYPKPFIVSKHLDDSLIGGYLLKVNGDIYDTSFKSKLLKIQNLGGVINE